MSEKVIVAGSRPARSQAASSTVRSSLHSSGVAEGLFSSSA
jgi:hypothetical protein